MFLQVSDSVHREVCLQPGVPGPGGACSWEDVCSRGVPGGDAPRRLLLRAVRILLESIIVNKSKKWVNKLTNHANHPDSVGFM